MSKTIETVETVEPVNYQLEIEKLQQQIKDLKSAAKPTKELKGDKVKFKTTKGEEIEGYGVLYYVVRHNNKLVYREASQVEVLEKRL